MVSTTDISDFIEAHAAGGITVVDVREADEYVAGHVPGAVFAPMSRITQYMSQIPRDERVYVICRSGNRSKAMSELLAAQGFDVTSVNGGTVAWAAAGRPLVTGRTPDGR